MRKGECDGCHRKDVWINKASRVPVQSDLEPNQEFCAECYDRYRLGECRFPGVVGRSKAEDMSAGQETAVRRMEDTGNA